jgi:hypothetical protein
MGHAKVTTTLGVYAHLYADDHGDAMAALRGDGGGTIAGRQRDTAVALDRDSDTSATSHRRRPDVGTLSAPKRAEGELLSLRTTITDFDALGGYLRTQVGWVPVEKIKAAS